MNSKRKYRNTLEFVEIGIQACSDNATDLTTASRIFLEHQLHAPAASLAILAIEELGKLFAIDGLLFARTDDHKAQAFSQSLRSHQAKFHLFGSFWRFLAHFASYDPRHQKDQPFDETIQTVINMLIKDGEAVLDRIGEETFAPLDILKQSGFYVTLSSGNLVSPRNGVDPAFAQLLYDVAFRASSTLNFVLKGGTLQREKRGHSDFLGITLCFRPIANSDG